MKAIENIFAIKKNYGIISCYDFLSTRGFPMKSLLIKIFQVSVPQSTEFDLEHALRVATATLLIETCRADFHEQESEIERMRQLLLEQFGLSDGDLDQLMQQARERANELVSLHPASSVASSSIIPVVSACPSFFICWVSPGARLRCTGPVSF